MIRKIDSFLRAIMLFAFLFSSAHMYAQTETFSDFLNGSSFSSGDTLGISDTATWSSIDTVYSAKGLVVFEIDPQSIDMIKDSYSCNVTLDIDTWDSLGVLTSQTVVMTVDFDTVANRPYHNKAIYYIKDAYRLKVTVGAFVYTQGGGSVSKPDLFRLYGELDYLRSYSFNCSVAPAFTSTSYDSQRNQFLVNWSQVPGANSYDLEWTFFDDSSLVVKDFASHNNIDSLFRIGATRINISGNLYRIPLIYSKGKLLYRVRGVKSLPGYQLQTTVWGNYSSWYSVQRHEPSLTWQSNISFAEEGKRKEVISYHDGTLRNRQSVTRVNSVDTAVVAETIYDYQGRASVQVLPSPAFNPQIRYYPKYNINNSGDPYSWVDFDTSGCGNMPVGLNTDSGTARYYSSSNPLSNIAPYKFIPDANGYPFSVTEYTPDNTGRINRQGGVGEDLTLGSGHETNYYYSKPSQQELDRLFGNDVGDHTHYTQEVTVDPNGQGSVAYKDAHDRVIATALTGQPPHNLDTLPEYVRPTLIRTFLTDPEEIRDSSVTTSTTFMAKTAGTFTFYYSIFPDHLTFANCNNDSICYDCYYNITISISSLCSPNSYRNEPLLVKTYQNYQIPQLDTNAFDSLFNLPFDTLCTSPDSSLADTFQVNLGVGSYFISRVVTVSNSALDFYSDKFIRENTCLSIDSFIQNELSTIDSSGCNLTCETCLAQLGDTSYFIANMFGALGGGFEPNAKDTVDAYNLYHKSYLKCMEICHPFDGCSVKRDLMLSDLTPGGQYAMYGVNPDETPADTSDETSLFFWDNSKFKYQVSPAVPYLDEQGQPIYVNTADGLKTPDQLSLQEFLDKFEASWAVSLLHTHPEYCQLTFCFRNSESADYNAQMLDVSTFAQADSLGLLDPLDSPDSLGSDPFFVGDTADGHTYLTAFRALLHSYKTVAVGSPWNDACPSKTSITYSLWQYASIIATHGQFPSGFDLCTDTLNIHDLCIGDQNVAWEAFKTLYQYEKEKFFAWRENNFSTLCDPSKPCYNLNIGTRLPQYHFMGHTGNCGGYSSEANYGYKIPRFSHQSISAPVANYTQAQAEASVSQAVLDSVCTSNCNTYRTGWAMRLREYCGYIDDATMATLLDTFVSICKGGCNIQHPMGSSSDSNLVAPRNFQTAMEQILGVSYNSACNAVIIDLPRPYDKQGNVDIHDIAFPKPSTCTCEKFDSLYSMMVAETGNYLLDSFQVYLRHYYNSWLTTEQLEIIRSNCNDTNCKSMSEAIRLPQALSCNDCLPCDSISNAYVDYLNDFSLVLETNSNPEIMASYMNNRFGFHLSPVDYYTFMSQCSIDTLISNPPPDCNDIKQLFYNYLNPAISGGQSMVDYFNSELSLNLTERDYSAWVYNCAFDTVTNGFINCDTLLHYKDLFDASGLATDSFVVFMNRNLFLNYNYLQYAAWIINCDMTEPIPFDTSFAYRISNGGANYKSKIREGVYRSGTNRNSSTPAIQTKSSQQIIDDYNRLKKARQLKSNSAPVESVDSLKKSQNNQILDEGTELGSNEDNSNSLKKSSTKSSIDLSALEIPSFIDSYNSQKEITRSLTASSDNSFINISESEGQNMEMNSMLMTPCFDLDSAVDLYNAIPSGLRPPLTIWLNHILGSPHTYAYYLLQLSACGITKPVYNVDNCLSINLLLANCRATGPLYYFADCLNDSIGINFTREEYFEWFDSCGINLIPCAELSGTLDSYNALNSAVRPPLTVYLNSVFSISLSYVQWSKLIQDCALDIPEFGSSCDSLRILYNIILLSSGGGGVGLSPESMLNASLGLSLSWHDYSLWLDSCSIPYIDCARLQNAIISYNLLDSSFRPPMVIWLNNYFNLNFNNEFYQNWLINCGLTFPEGHISCETLIERKSMCHQPFNHFVECMNLALGLDYTYHEYIVWLKSCKSSAIPCDSLVLAYANYQALTVKPPLTVYLNFVFNVNLTFEDYLLMFGECIETHIGGKTSCDTLSSIYNICATSQPPYLLSHCINEMLGYNYSMQFYINWLDSCRIEHTQFSCELLVSAVGEFDCFQDSISLTDWLNYFFQANHTDSFYLAQMAKCNVHLKCCSDISKAIDDYNCDKTLPILDFLNDYFKTDLSIDEWNLYMAICGDSINCDTCSRLVKIRGKYNCNDTLSFYQYLAIETGWTYSNAQWDSLLTHCKVSIPCKIDCGKIGLALKDYDCDGEFTLVNYLNNYFGYHYSDSTWLMYLDSCHLQIPCLDCTKLYGIMRLYHCLTDSTIAFFFNDSLKYSYTQAEYEYALAFCHIDYDCDTCRIFRSYVNSHSCSESILEYINKRIPHEISDTTLIAILDSCNIDWIGHCIPNCDTLHYYVNRYPCYSGYTIWAWLNKTMHINFTRYEWSRIFLVCPMDTSCNMCVYLDTLMQHYPCHSSQSIVQYMDSVRGWTYSDTTIISRLDSCGIDWIHHCVPNCSTLAALAHGYPCDTTIAKWQWLNDTLNLSLSQYEWSRIFINCPLSNGCDSCSYLRGLSHRYPCDGPWSVGEWIDSLSGWNYSDTVVIAMLDSCNIDWTNNCIPTCSTLVALAHGYPCHSTIPRWQWFNDSLHLSFSQYEWSQILLSCPLVSSCDSCSLLDSLVTSYPCDSSFTLVSWIDSLSGWSYSDSVLISMLDSCNINWIQHCIPTCDTLEYSVSRFPCNTGIPIWQWLNSDMNLHFSQYEWNRIFVACPQDTSCNMCLNLDSLVESYPCDSSFTLADWIDSLGGWNYSDTTIIAMLDSCGINWILHCIPTCDTLEYSVSRFPCNTGIPIWQWLNSDMNLHFSQYEWNRIFVACPQDTSCNMCLNLDSLVESYPCDSSFTLADWIDSLGGWNYSDTTIIAMLDSCGINWIQHCIPTCDTLEYSVSRFPCNTGIPIWQWLNSDMNLHFSQYEWNRIFVACPQDTSCNMCIGLDSLVQSYPCDSSFTLAEWIDSLGGWNYSDTLIISMLDSCNIDWTHHCIDNCDSLEALASHWRCASPIPLWQWLNDTLQLHFSEYEWSQLYIHCAIDTTCDTCTYMGNLIDRYPCDTTLSLRDYLAAETGWNYSDTTFISMLDSCNIDWMGHCIPVCDTLIMAAAHYPCNATTTLNAWLNDTLNVNFTNYEWSRIFIRCPIIEQCDTCSYLTRLIGGYDCTDTMALTFYLNTYSGWNLADSTYDRLLDICNVDTAYLFSSFPGCDSIHSMVYTYSTTVNPIPSGVFAWLNDQMTTCISELQFLAWFDSCNVDTTNRFCETLDSLYYAWLPFKATFAMETFLNDSGPGWNFDLWTYIHMLDSCGIDPQLPCDTLASLVDSFNLLPLPRPPFYLWVNSLLDLSYPDSIALNLMMIDCPIVPPPPPNCVELKMYIDYYNLNQPGPDMYTWLNSELVLHFTVGQYLDWFNYCALDTPSACNVYDSLYQEYISTGSTLALEDYMNNHLDFNLTYYQYLQIFNQCGIHITIPCDTLSILYSNFLTLPVNTVFFVYANSILGLTPYVSYYNEHYYDSMLVHCGIDTLGIDTTQISSCDTLQALYNTYQLIIPVQDLVTWFNAATSLNYTYWDYVYWFDHCDIFLPIPCDTLNYLAGYYHHFNPTGIPPFDSWMNSNFNVSYSYSEYISMLDSCGGLISACDSLDEAMSAYLALNDTSITPWAFVNTYLGHSWSQSDLQNELRACHPDTAGSLMLCDQGEFPAVSIDTLHIPGCLDDFITLAYHNAMHNYLLYKDSLRGEFRNNYMAHCLGSMIDSFYVDGPLLEYHYTLYYYDQAGNLVSTIPPNGVHPFNDPDTLQQIADVRKGGFGPSPIYRTSPFATIYNYNSLNKVVGQQTPDAGQSKFFYDNLGRVIVALNALGNNLYTVYDALGRVEESGVNYTIVPMTETIARDPALYNNWLTGGGRYEVTTTYYDSAQFVIPGFTQENLRSRVSSVVWAQWRNPYYLSGSHFSYDISGNVKTLIQEFYRNEGMGYKFKRIDYDYDLISGKVNYVYYQRDSIDQFTHHYEYDDDNRLTHVYTSRDGLTWDEDAHYTYYMHGPLARLELGENKVQGIDYAYTLQGWMKGINSSQLDPNRDMGEDGKDLTSGIDPVSRDAYGFNLGYFNQDFSPIGGSNFEANYNPSGGSTFGDDSYKHGSLMDNGLYNGNIRHSVLAMDSLNFQNIGYVYKYDQLNRLVGQQAYNGIDTTNNKWTTASVLPDYMENVHYDPNGNILSYERNATTNHSPNLRMDSLVYNYTTGTNKLDHVDDSIPKGNHAVDIDDQAPANYVYDAMGNLIIDVQDSLNYWWYSNGKCGQVYQTNAIATNNCVFTYDPFGNRIETYTEHPNTGEYDYYMYVRDAQGNIMATYTLDNYDSDYKLREFNIYGSSRLGVVKVDTLIYTISALPPTQPDFYSAWSGKKLYELTNHLGNVLTTITDKKVLFDNNNDNSADWSIPEIATANDYYPFGMIMPGRTKSTEDYRFGFNDKENLNDVKGVGKLQDYGMRNYDPRLGRFLCVDPIQAKFPMFSPYQFGSLNPIMNIDLDGLEGVIYFTAIQQTLRLARDKVLLPIVNTATIVGSGIGIGLTNFASQTAHGNFENLQNNANVFKPAVYHVTSDWKWEELDGGTAEVLPIESGKEVLKSTINASFIAIPTENTVEKIGFSLYKAALKKGVDLIEKEKTNSATISTNQTPDNSSSANQNSANNNSKNDSSPNNNKTLSSHKFIAPKICYKSDSN